jgi:hypothetical protein
MRLTIGSSRVSSGLLTHLWDGTASTVPLELGRDWLWPLRFARNCRSDLIRIRSRIIWALRALNP